MTLRAPLVLVEGHLLHGKFHKIDEAPAGRAGVDHMARGGMNGHLQAKTVHVP